MNKALISIVLIISLMGCVALNGSGVELLPGETRAEKLFEKGIGQPWVGGNPPSSSIYDSIYSQYYWSYKGSAPKKHIETPKKHMIVESKPTTVYFSYQMQAVPYSQYQSIATYTGGNSLWIQGPSSWSQYAKVPLGSGLSLLATSLAGGNGYLYEITPDGKLSKESVYFFPGSSQIDFYADAIGQHVLLFIIGGQVSNAIVIDVTGSYPPILSANGPRLSARSDNSSRDNSSAGNRGHSSDDRLPGDERISGISGWKLHRNRGNRWRRT